MRADRLVTALLLLQARGRMTAAALAEELEVSVATARRDLEALSGAGIPVYPQPGRGGGWQLLGGARTDLTGLTEDEARALFMVVGPSASASPAVTSALRKLRQAIPAPFRDDAAAAADAVVVDPTGWGGRTSSDTTDERLQTLRDAIVSRRRMVLTYTDRRGRASTRTVEPWGLADKDGVWYLLAGTDRGRRTFRLERIVDAEVTAEQFARPDGLELSTAWGEVVDEVERHRARVGATVLIDARFADYLQGQFGRHGRRTGDTPDGRAVVEVAAATPRIVAERLAGWGGLLEVVAPRAVRAELARIGTELVAQYSDGHDVS